ncbi:MAG: SpoIIE family protein phosphatase [Bacteroidales bacterium]|nr:SpoIIE family protein phosphatase [Bacteroidales bacterium]
MSIRIAILLILTTTFCIGARAQYADTSSNKDSLIARLKMELASKEDEIIRKQVLLNEREREIFEKELTIDKLNRSISRQSQAITDQVDRLKDQKESVRKMQEQLEVTKRELDKAAEQLEIRNKEINFVETELTRQKKHLDEQRKEAEEQKAILDTEIADKQRELEQLNTRNELLNNRLLMAWTAIALFLIMLAVIAKFYIDKRRDNQKLEEKNNALTLAHEEISAQKEEIANQNDKIIESILYAQKIQQAVMPMVDYFNQYLPEHFIMLKPRNIVSGDFYWGTHIGDKFVYTAADCTGHGVPGAFMSLLGITFLNEIAGRSNSKFVTAAGILTSLRLKIITYLHQTGKEGEQQDGMDIALCIYDKTASKLQYAGAFNPLVIIRDGNLTQYDADEMPIGYYENQSDRFTNHVIDIQPGDMAYMFTDGYADQFGMVDGRKKKYLVKRFKDFLLQIYTFDMKEQERRLEENLAQWRGDLKQLDDVLVFGARF